MWYGAIVKNEYTSYKDEIRARLLTVFYQNIDISDIRQENQIEIPF